MWFIGVEVEQETSAPPPKKSGNAPVKANIVLNFELMHLYIVLFKAFC